MHHISPCSLPLILPGSFPLKPHVQGTYSLASIVAPTPLNPPGALRPSLRPPHLCDCMHTCITPHGALSHRSYLNHSHSDITHLLAATAAPTPPGALRPSLGPYLCDFMCTCIMLHGAHSHQSVPTQTSRPRDTLARCNRGSNTYGCSQTLTRPASL